MGVEGVWLGGGGCEGTQEAVVFDQRQADERAGVGIRRDGDERVRVGIVEDDRFQARRDAAFDGVLWRHAVLRVRAAASVAGFPLDAGLQVAAPRIQQHDGDARDPAQLAKVRSQPPQRCQQLTVAG